MYIRRCIYLKDGQPITLAYVSGIDSSHPEVVDSTPPPPPGPKAQRGPQLTEDFIRKVLGKPRPPTEADLNYERIARRIEREGA